MPAGKYNSDREILEIAQKLLDEYDSADSEWSRQVGIKIDKAISAFDRTPPIDGETFVNGILERFQQVRQA